MPLAKVYQSNPRFQRQQAQQQERQSLAMAKANQRAARPGPLGAYNWNNLPEALNKLAAFAYDKLAQNRDDSELAALASEIEARFSKGAGGVLIKRLTQRVPDSAGNFLPQYLGLQVAGEGMSEPEAMLAYRKAIDDAAGPRQPRFGAVCTASNPTGQRLRSQATLRAAPDGFNFGYASALAARVMPSYETNPANIGRIEMFGQASPIQPRSYIEDSFHFISKADWDKWKVARRR